MQLPSTILFLVFRVSEMVESLLINGSALFPSVSKKSGVELWNSNVSPKESGEYDEEKKRFPGDVSSDKESGPRSGVT